MFKNIFGLVVMSRRWRRLADSLIVAQPFRSALSRHAQFKITRLVARFLAQTVLLMRRRKKHRQLVAHVGQLPAAWVEEGVTQN
jgi:hypothetical protein